MAGTAAKIRISERQQKLLEEFRKSRTIGKCLVQRATIILLGFSGMLNETIAPQVGLNRQQVGLWRQRWRDAWDALCVWECTEPHRLREAIIDVLSDAPRPGAPPTFTAEQVAQIVALACELPKLSGRPIDHWTLRELRDEAIKRTIVTEISVSQIGRFLQQAAVQPHRKKMWLNTTEKDPQKFQAEVENICRTYLEAPAKAAAGTHTVSVDDGEHRPGRRVADRRRPGEPRRHRRESLPNSSATSASSARSAAAAWASSTRPSRTRWAGTWPSRCCRAQMLRDAQAAAPVRARGAGGGAAAPHQHRAGLRRRRARRHALLRHAVHPGAGPGRGPRRAAAAARRRGSSADPAARRTADPARPGAGPVAADRRFDAAPRVGSMGAIPPTGTEPPAGPHRADEPAATGRRVRPCRRRSGASDRRPSSSSSCPAQQRAGVRRAAERLTYWQSVARIGVQVAEALDYAHQPGHPAPRHQAVEPAAGHPGHRLGDRLRPGQGRRPART